MPFWSRSARSVWPTAGLERYGHGPGRKIQTGIGSVPVQRAKVRDRGADDLDGVASEPVAFTSAIPPKVSATH